MISAISRLLGPAAWVLIVAQASAQAPLGETPAQGRAAIAAVDNLTDMQIAAWISVENHSEIALGELAEIHAQSQEVKNLAQEVVKEDTSFGRQLMRFAGPLTSSSGAPAGQQFNSSQSASGQERAVGATGQTAAEQTLTSLVTGQPASVGGGVSSGAINFLATMEQIGVQYNQSITRELAEKQDSAFDRAYMGQQIDSHIRLLATMRVLREYASPELQKVIEQRDQTARRQLEQFKQQMQPVGPSGP